MGAGTRRQLTRAEVTDALDLGAHAVTVRLSRLKGRLETVRQLVRALSAERWCAGLAQAAQGVVWAAESVVAQPAAAARRRVRA